MVSCKHQIFLAQYQHQTHRDCLIYKGLFGEVKVFGEEEGFQGKYSKGGSRESTRC